MFKVSKLAMVAALAVLAAMPGRASADEHVTMVLEYPFPLGEHAALRLAAVKGWYKEQGLDVDIQMGKGSLTTIQQVAAGQADVGLAQLSAMATTVSAGVPVTSVMGMVQVGDLAVTIANDTGYKTVKDLKGKKIGSQATGASTPLIEPFFSAVGLGKNDVNMIYVDASALLSTYLTKGTDGVIAGAAYSLPRTEAQRPSTTIYFSDVGLPLPGYGLVARRDSLDSKADMLRKFVQINQRAWKYIIDGHQQEGVDAVVSEGGFRPDKKVLMDELLLLIPRFYTQATKGKPLGWQSDADWDASLKIMEKVGLVKPGWKIADFYDNRFISDK